MAKKTLTTSFKDDTLDSSMSGKRRYNMITNSDGSVSFEDVTKYTQTGSTLGASQINAICKATNDSFDASKVIDDYDTLMATTESGYAAGALAVKKLNSNLTTGIHVLNIDKTLWDYSSSRRTSSYSYTVTKAGTYTIICQTTGTAYYGATLYINDSAISLPNQCYYVNTYTTKLNVGDVIKYTITSGSTSDSASSRCIGCICIC